MSRRRSLDLLLLVSLVSLVSLAAPAAGGAQLAAPRATAAASWSDQASPAGAAAFDSARLARIDAWLQRLVADRRIPGAVVMLVHDGRVGYHKAFGVRDLGTGAPLRTDDIFRIASQTKAITSLGVMMLWEEGKLGLDDPIARYLPAFEKQTVLTAFHPTDSTYESRPARRRTTVRQLLTHTSGLDYADIGSADFKAIYAKAGITALGREGELLGNRIDVLARLPLKQEPGERFTYSLSVDVLGRLIEVVSGMPLDQFFRTRIFEPLGMRDTYFELPPEKRGRLVALHTLKDGALAAMHDAALGIHADYPARRMTYFSGGGGLSGTTADYARFLQLVLDGGALGGTRLLGRKTVELMLTDQLGAAEPPFGLGFGLETPKNDARSPLTLGSFEWGGAFSTTYWADPKERIVALLYANTYGVPVELDKTFRTLVYSALK